MAEVTINLTSRFRQRKINLKQNLRVYKQSNLPENAEDVRGDLLGVVETGVDKNEEDERHLQAVLSASTNSFVDNTKPKQDAYIPTPPASKKYSEYKKFYYTGWVETESYIRSSATVEDAQGNVYNMDEIDDEFLVNEVNAKISDNKQKCSEEEFEMICTLIERIVNEKQPYLATDYNQLMSYKELEPHIIHLIEERRQALKNPLSLEKLLLDSNSSDYAPEFEGSPHRATHISLKLFGSTIYEHWRQRKLDAKGESISPTLRYETGLASDESDPYVCFRHREVRQSRKTRRTDQQNIQRMRKLHAEMQCSQNLMDMVLKRERTRLLQIQSDFEIFELRCRVKALKRKLSVGPESDDMELMVSTTKRARQEKQAQLKREAHEREKKARAAQDKLDREREKREGHKESSRSSDSASSDRKNVLTSSGSRIPDLDHVTVEQQQIEREMEIEKAFNEKLEQRREQDKGWVHVTDTSQLPSIDFFSKWHFKDGKSYVPKPNILQPDIGLLRDTDFAGSEQANSLDLELNEQDRLSLPLDNLSLTAYDPPEVIQINDENEISKFGELDFQADDNFSVPRFTGSHIFCRKRMYGDQIHIDRVYPSNMNPMSGFKQDLNFNCKNGVASEADERLRDRFLFDCDMEDEDAYVEMLMSDPAKLNQIDIVTQNVRFSSMLTAKSLDFIHEAAAYRRKVHQAIQRRQQLQLQQRAQAEAQAQRNAQLQAQTNLRMQQAQRTMQRQQQQQQQQQQRRKPEGIEGSPTPSEGTQTPVPTSTSSPVPDKKGSPFKTPQPQKLEAGG